MAGKQPVKTEDMCFNLNLDCPQQPILTPVDMPIVTLGKIFLKLKACMRMLQGTQNYNTASSGGYSTGLCSWCAEPGGCGLCKHHGERHHDRNVLSTSNIHYCCSYLADLLIIDAGMSSTFCCCCQYGRNVEKLSPQQVTQLSG